MVARADTVTIPAGVLRELLCRIFRAAGCDAENADIISEGVLEADLRGHWIQGTDHIFSTVEDLQSGRLNGLARPWVARQTPATAQVDGDGASGFAAGRYAADLAISKAKETGAAAVGLVRGGDIFRLGWYAERMASAGLAGMVFTNTVPTHVHPAGGIDPILGTNPIAFGFPASDGVPIVVDLATSASALGHIRIASYGDEPIPEGVAIDRDGVPTNNAKLALAGALTPLGGHKGFALGLAVALLSGPVVGAAIGDEIRDALVRDEGLPRRGHLFVAIDPAAFGDPATCLRRIGQHGDEIKAGRRMPSVREILLPGERSHRTRQRSLDKGVELLRTVWQHTLEIAERLHVQAPSIP
jgi:LDH2 family malate/lactate/ureidoglycolate dehydrogenase